MDISEVIDCIYIDGFDYTFLHYSDFNEVENDMFHELRKEYVEAHKNLHEFLETFGLEE